MGKELTQNYLYPYIIDPLREPFGRALEGTIGQPVDLMNQAIGLIGADPSLKEMGPLYSERPVLGSQAIQEGFGIPPQEQLPTWPERAAAIAYQNLGPLAVGGAISELGPGAARWAKNLGERGGKPAEPAAPLWRDTIQDALAEWPMERGTVGQLRAHLARYRGTKAQADWIGLEDWLKDRPQVTKQEIAQFVQENPFRVEETVLGAPLPNDVVKARWHEHLVNQGLEEEPQHQWENLTPYAREHYMQETSIGVPQPTQYERYQTPGGQNYRELLIRMPRKSGVPVALENQIKEVEAAREQARATYGRDSAQYTYLDRDLAELQHQATDAEIGAYNAQFKSSHFSKYPNVMAWTRFNERTDVHGTPGIHLEELQSEWHAKGRQEGYKPRGDLRLRGLTEDAAEQLGLAREDVPRGVPDAPFKTTWPMVLMKRMIRWAVDHDMPQITWTTGEQQAERYNLGLKNITSARMQPGRGPEHERWYVTTQGRSEVLSPEQAEELKRLLKGHTPVKREYTVREVGQRPEWGQADPYWAVEFNGQDSGWNFKTKAEAEAHAQQYRKHYETHPEYDLTEHPLTIGGEWAKQLYDKELVNDTNKFVKRWGGRVGQTEIPVANPMPSDYQLIKLESADNWAIYDTRRDVIVRTFKSKAEADAAMKLPTEKVHVLKITPQLKEAAKKGMELSQAPGERKDSATA